MKKASNRGWFAKGQSGNPRGRPPGRRGQAVRSLSAFDVVVSKRLSFNGNGVSREIGVEEALQHRIYQDAIAGKRLAQREVLKWVEKRDVWLAEHRPKPRPRQTPPRMTGDPDNADAALVLLGIANHNPNRADLAQERAQLLLEPWAVQAALSRRRGGTVLADSDVKEIRRCTRDPESLRWPRGSGE